MIRDKTVAHYLFDKKYKINIPTRENWKNKLTTIPAGLIGDCHEAFNRLAGTKRVTILWVPGHSGIIGNDRADELAKAGVGKQFIGPESLVEVSAKCLALEFKQ